MADPDPLVAAHAHGYAQAIDDLRGPGTFATAVAHLEARRAAPNWWHPNPRMVSLIRAEERAKVRAELLRLIELMDTPYDQVDKAALADAADVHRAWYDPRELIRALADRIAPEPKETT
jgi:hypothetical protein